MAADMPNRRGVLAFALLATVAASGCGWTPLYADIETGPADAELRAIRVDPILDRIGQRLELALRKSFNPNGEPSATRYVLHTTLVVSRQDLGIQSQGLGTRSRVDVQATFTLTEAASGKQLLLSTSHAADSFDIVANGYATVVAEEDARNRAGEELRRDIVTKLTLFLQRRAAGQV
jgi:LPS-assembly lipoprotein